VSDDDLGPMAAVLYAFGAACVGIGLALLVAWWLA
jgi:hypothetical protein